MNFQYVLSDRSITVVIDGQPYHVPRPDDLKKGQETWDILKAALLDSNTTKDQMLALVNPAIGVTEATKNFNGISLYNGELYYNGNKVHSVLADRILDIVREGFPVEPWVKFAENVYANPADFSREELYLFLEKAELPITNDGCFLAYKNVRDDYLDIYSGTMSNTIGSIVQMQREDVDPDRNNTCSKGLHFASKDYLKSYRSSGNSTRTVIVKINPRDVVSIPSDYDNTKGRCWRYEVVGEIPFEYAQDLSWPSIMDEDDFDDEDWYESDLYSPYGCVVESVSEDTHLDMVLNEPNIKAKKRGFLSWFMR